MRRRIVLAVPLALTACGLGTRPYAERRQWPLLVRRPQALPPRTGGPVLQVRSFTAGPSQGEAGRSRSEHPKVGRSEKPVIWERRSREP